MLRLTEMKLPLDHAEADIRAAVPARLGLPDRDVLSCTIFRRAVDARKKAAISLQPATKQLIRLIRKGKGRFLVFHAGIPSQKYKTRHI